MEMKFILNKIIKITRSKSSSCIALAFEILQFTVSSPQTSASPSYISPTFQGKN